MTEILICRVAGCNNKQPLINIRQHPNGSIQLGGNCPSCGKFSWIPLEKNENKRPASQKDNRLFIEKYNHTKCVFCGIDKKDLPDGNTLECAHIIDYAEGGEFDEKNIIVLCTRCHKLQHHLRHWWI
jgi:hypothetical protein